MGACQGTELSPEEIRRSNSLRLVDRYRNEYGLELPVKELNRKYSDEIFSIVVRLQSGEDVALRPTYRSI